MESIVFVVAAALGFFLSAVTGKYLIPYLHKLKYGQTIKEIGPTWHKNKQGTPTMGGLMFIGATVVVVILGYFVLLSMGLVTTQQTVGLFAGLCMALAFGAAARDRAKTPARATSSFSRCVIDVFLIVSILLQFISISVSDKCPCRDHDRGIKIQKQTWRLCLPFPYLSSYSVTDGSSLQAGRSSDSEIRTAFAFPCP